MGMAMGSGGGQSADMNVTPLIDVLLVLIIIFMIVVTQEQRSGLRAQIPQPAEDSQAPQNPVRTIVIRVLYSGEKQEPSLKINADSVAWGDLKSRLHDIFKARAERVAFVQGEDEVEFQRIADVIDIAREAGVDRVGLLPEQMAHLRP